MFYPTRKRRHADQITALLHRIPLRIRGLGFVGQELTSAAAFNVRLMPEADVPLTLRMSKADHPRALIPGHHRDLGS